jgi:hypothetical protein
MATAPVLEAVPDRLEPDVVGPPAPSESEIQEKLGGIVDRLDKLAKDQVQRKGHVEQRWLENLRAFHGRYDEKTEANLADSTKSRAFVKITRKKSNSWEARLSALLFPTDEENWDITPTPVPSLHETAKEALAQAQQMVEQANQAPTEAGAQVAAAGAQVALDVATKARQELGEAQKRGEAMRREMKDQLVECEYAAECRLAIRDGVRLGTGIVKGPLAGDRQRGSWVQLEGEYVYKREEDPAPIYKWVDPWAYFPDMSAIRPEDREFEFERHLWSTKDLRRLARERGFSKDAVRTIIDERNVGQVLNDSSMNYLVNLRAITGATDVIKDRFVGWEYHGPLTNEDVATVLRALGREEEAVAIELEDDPLNESRVICYFCEGKVLKLAPAYPLDSGESLYSLFTFEEAEGSIFGYGIPEIMSDSQKSMNGAWRMALDNAALSVGPQIFIDRDSIEPANRSWALTPRKVWYKKKGAGMAGGTVLETKAIENNVAEIMNLVEVSRRFIDDETALPVQAEGELTDNPNITATATNFMAMASNITFRRVVKNYDDGVTTPNIRRLYDWNMQHNSRDDIKGDMKVDARGSTALLTRELQAQMLLNMAQNWSSHPVLKHAVKTYETIVESIRASMIQPTLVLKEKEEFDASVQAEAQAAQEQQPDPQQNPSVIAANARLEAAKVDSAARIEVANIQRQTELLQTAQHYDIKIEELKTRLGIKSMDIGHKERVIKAEAAMEDAVADEARAHGEAPKGSGGYVSQ